MNTRKNEPNRTAVNSTGAEAELLAEVLARMNEKTAEGRSVKTIDLIELFYFLLSKLHFILLGMIMGAVLLSFFAIKGYTPVYTATSKLYIMGTTGTNIFADLQIGTVLTMDYQEVFKTWEVHQMVNEELGTNYSYSMLQSLISVYNPEDTRVLYITAQYPDAKMAADIANAYASAAQRFIVETMKTDEPSNFSIALVPGLASGTSVTSHVIRGMLLGTVLVIGVLVLLFVLDNRPKSPDDITHYGNIPTLAVIPMSSHFAEDKKQRKKRYRR